MVTTAPDSQPQPLPASSTLRGGSPHPAPVQPLPAPAEVQAQTQQIAQPVFAQPVRRQHPLLVIGIVGFIVVGFALLLVFGYFLLALGPALTAIGGLLALIPLAIVLFGVHWIDRWEPEPRLLLVLAFLYGAGNSVAWALLVDTGVQLAARGTATGGAVFLQAVVQAPIVEEVGKGLGVLIIYLAARKYFDGPIDGVVYAAMVAAGFAFTENIQYFGIQIWESGGFDGSVAQILFIRGILSPFAHVMFTSLTGLAIGIAARRGTAWLGILLFFAGLIPAILLHALWNGALFFVNDFYGYYAAVQMPLFAIGVVIVVLLRRREVAVTQERLKEYAAAGWINPAEVPALATPGGRRQARAWAKAHGLDPVMKEYIKDATHLAYTRQRIVTGRDRIGSQRDEALLLQQVSQSRHALAAATPT